MNPFNRLKKMAKILILTLFTIFLVACRPDETERKNLNDRVDAALNGVIVTSAGGGISPSPSLRNIEHALHEINAKLAQLDRQDDIFAANGMIAQEMGMDLIATQ